MELKNILVEGDARATAIKLLEWLKEPCINKQHSGEYVVPERFHCANCMSELESKLKESHD